MPSEDAIGGSDCEQIGDGLLAQPVNAVTSSAYVLAAVVLWLRLPKSDRFGVGGLYCLILALVGVGSILYHGPQVPGSRLMHDLPIPALFLLVAVVLLQRRRKGAALLPGWSRAEGAGLLVLLVAAVTSYALGRTGSPACDSTSIVQLHGLWHALTAFGLMVLGQFLFRPRPLAPARGGAA